MQWRYLSEGNVSISTWSQHVRLHSNHICARLTQYLVSNVETLIATCPINVKSLLYQSPVRPTYACTIWAPHSQTDIQSIEAVQRRVARFTLNRYGKYQSVASMVDELDWPTLQTRRKPIKTDDV